MDSVFVSLFEKLELKLQIKVVKELYRTGSLSPETVREIGPETGQRLLKELHLSLVTGLLNKSSRETEKNIVDTLEAEDPEICQEIKNAMFTFDDFAKLPDATIIKWLNKCVDEDLIIAMGESKRFLREKILGCMGKARASGIRKALENKPPRSLDETFQAMTKLIGILRDMEFAGEIIIERFE